MFSEKWASSFDILKFHKLLSSTEKKNAVTTQIFLVRNLHTNDRKPTQNTINRSIIHKRTKLKHPNIYSERFNSKIFFLAI